MGEDPDREGLHETPARVARMYAEMFSGLHEDPRTHLQKFFTEQYDEVVLVRDISFNSMCEHHMLPFMGLAHIGYMPNGRVIGLSKLARVVEVVARRPQVQERMTETIANLLLEELEAKGVAVVIEATHTCMTIRGIRKPGSLCVTSAMKGIFRSNLSSRSEMMNLIYGGRRVTARPAPCSAARDSAKIPARLRSLFSWDPPLVAILTQFIFRLSFGMALGMALTDPRQVTSGYYRNHLYVLLGLNVLAAMVAVTSGQQFAPGAADRGRGAQLCRRRALAVRKAAGRHRRLGAAFGGRSVGRLGGHQLATRRPIRCKPRLLALDPLTSGLLLGMTMAAMFLGHWYLNTPTMAIGPLERLVVLMGVAVGRAGLFEAVVLAIY